MLCAVPCEDPVNCLVDPCGGTTCQGFPDAVCVSDYCGAATPGSSKTDRKSSVKVSKYLLTAPVIHKSFVYNFPNKKQ